MAFVRRITTKDAIWARAWTADAFADLAAITAILGPEAPHHGDIAFVTADSNYYVWLDDGSWVQITNVAKNDSSNIFSNVNAIDLRATPVTRIGYRNTGAGANLKQWYAQVNGVLYQIITVDDLGGTPLVVFQIDRAGNASIPGLLDLSAVTAGQIKFPAAQNASADANTLDDYEEGAWTPALTGSGGASGQVYAQQTGSYTKIGRFVQCNFFITLSTLGTITGGVRLTGLPFVANAENGVPQVMVFAGLSTNWINIYSVVNPSTSQALVRGIQAAGVSNVANVAQADLSNIATLAGGLLYTV